MIRTFIAALGFAALATTGHAETVEFQCNFNSYSDPQNAAQKTAFNFEINWDTLTGDAFIKGNNGVSKLFAYSGPEAVTFMEPLHAGGVHVTTIKFDGVAAHSRNTIIGATEFAPSQYYGRCANNS